MKRMRHIVCGIVVGLSLAAMMIAPSQAQNTNATTDIDAVTPPSLTGGKSLDFNTPGKTTASSIDPKDIPDILMKEVTDVEANCRVNYFYSSFHDCKCIAVKFLDARLKSDPDTPKDRVIDAVANQCVDEASIAGYVNRACSSYMQNIRKDYEAFCKCSANMVARNYAKSPKLNMRYIEALRRNAYIACGRPQ